MQQGSVEDVVYRGWVGHGYSAWRCVLACFLASEMNCYASVGLSSILYVGLRIAAPFGLKVRSCIVGDWGAWLIQSETEWEWLSIKARLQALEFVEVRGTLRLYVCLCSGPSGSVRPTADDCRW